MQSRIHLHLFQFRTNLCLLAAVVILTPISYLIPEITVRLLIICLIYALLLLAWLPTILNCVHEFLMLLTAAILNAGIRLLMYIRRARPDTADEPKVRAIIEPLLIRMNMNTRRRLEIIIRPKWTNAQAPGPSTIVVGKILLDAATSDQLNGILAHELAHIKGRHQIKWLLAFGIVAMLLIVVRWFLNIMLPQSENLFIIFPAIAAIVISILSLFSRQTEYAADTLASEYLGKTIITEALIFLAGINNQNVNTDPYLHGSITKRISNLSGPKICRLSRWYFNKFLAQ